MIQMGSLIQERSSLKILHLYSDWRWTGPCEGVLQICKKLMEMGHDIRVAFRSPPFFTEERTIEKKAKEMGINAVTDFSLDRYMGIRNTIKDLINLPRYLRKEGFDIVHMHLSHDHFLGTFCAYLLGKKRPILIRSFHKRSVLKNNLFNKFLLRLTDGYLFFTEGFRERYILDFGIDPKKTGIQKMTVDLERFDPEKEYKDMRKEFGIPKDAIVIGTVARFQRYRRMDWFLEAAKEIIRRHKNVYFLLIGRSSQIKDTVIDPIKRLKIEDRAIVAGYRRKDYVDTISCLDIFTLLMPGSDGAARALREAMAMGKACVVSDFGMLPEIVGDSAFVIHDIRSLISAWDELIKDPEKRKELGKRAREYSLKNFNIEDAAKGLEEFYFKMLSHRAY